MIRYLIPALVLVAALGCAGPPSPGEGRGGGPGGGEGGGPPGPPPEMSPAQRLAQTMKELTKRLELTPEQAEKVRAIIKAGEDKKANMHPAEDDFANPKKMEIFLIRLQQVDQETKQALSQVLSESQLEEYQDYLKERRKRFLGGQGPGGGPPGGGRPPGGRPPGGG